MKIPDRHRTQTAIDDLLNIRLNSPKIRIAGETLTQRNRWSKAGQCLSQPLHTHTSAYIQKQESLKHCNKHSSKNIYPVSELLEHVKRLVLQNQGCKISMTHGNNRISRRSPSGVSVLVVQHKPEALYQTKDSLE